jgi:hypothetical protein
MREHDAETPAPAPAPEVPAARRAAAALPERTLALQRAAGNRATTRALARDALGDWWHAVEVNAIDATEHKGLAGRYANIAYHNTVQMEDVGSMVLGVLALIGSEDKIKRLNIFDHGSAVAIRMGRDEFSGGNVDLYEADFKQLRGKFAPGGYVHLWNCKGGQHVEALKLLAQYMQVRVVAGKGYQHAFGFNTDDYVDVMPDGSISEHTFGPGLR